MVREGGGLEIKGNTDGEGWIVVAIKAGRTSRKAKNRLRKG